MNPYPKKTLYQVYGKFFNPIPYKKQYVMQILRVRHKPKKILFYPERPSSFYTIYKICHVLGCQITNDFRADVDLAVWFEDTTSSSLDGNILALSKQVRFLNQACTDISKERVAKAFKEVFGYGLDIDPETHSKYVRKSNSNTAHDGIIFDTPTLPETGFVYQAIINNRYSDLFKDIRAPVINGIIPFVYYNYKKNGDRFGHPAISNFVETESALSRSEVDMIADFVNIMGLDVGELDILRDRDSKKIYVVDVNNTPYGPPRPLARGDRWKALARLSRLFKESFLTNVNENSLRHLEATIK